MKENKAGGKRRKDDGQLRNIANPTIVKHKPNSPTRISSLHTSENFLHPIRGPYPRSNSLPLLPPFSSLLVYRILVICSDKPEAMSKILPTVTRLPPKTTVQYFTMAKTTELDNVPETLKSLLDECDGVVVAFFAEQSLVERIRNLTPKPVVGIIEASLSRALDLGGRVGVVTTKDGLTGSPDESIRVLTGSLNESIRVESIRVESIRVVCIKVNDEDAYQFEKRGQLFKETKCVARNLAARSYNGIILCLLGIPGLLESIQKAVGEKATIIDPFTAGLDELWKEIA